jgi:hypothetical protein
MTLEKLFLGKHWIGGSMGTWAGLNVVASTKLHTHSGIGLRAFKSPTEQLQELAAVK